MLLMLALLAAAVVCRSSVRGESYADYSQCQGGALICQNNGICINDTSCLCYPGFTGNDCSYDVTCDPISSMLMNAQLLQNQGNEYGATVTYTCRYGYQLSDATVSSQSATKTVFCNVDSNWGPNFATCQPVCPVIALWNGYRVEGLATLSQARLQGGELLYTCSGNYDRSAAAAFGKSEGDTRYKFADKDTGVKTAFCIDGEWTPPIVPCIDYLYHKELSSSLSLRHQMTVCLLSATTLTSITGLHLLLPR